MLRQTFLAAVLFLLQVVYACGPLAADEGQPAASAKITTVLLRTMPDRGSNLKQLKRILAREIFRQSLLLAAREDFGLSTRDEQLGESYTPADSVAVFTVDVQFEDSKPSGIKIVREVGSKSETVLEEKIDLPLDYPRLVERAERLATTRFAEALQAAGCTKRDSETLPAATLPSGIARPLAQMRMISQFDAVRRLHACQANARATPATTDALVRGYANLGLLTSFLCHPAPKIFKARALLYAERLCRTSAENPAAWWLRGYALSLTGLPTEALDSISRGDQLFSGIEAANAKQRRPEWVGTIDRFCRFQTSELDAGVADDELKELTQVLRFVATDSSHFSTQTVEAALELLPKLPECYLVHDALCQAGGVSILHAATQAGPETLLATLPERLGEIEGLPDGVAQAARREAGIEALIKELDIADKRPSGRDEMSWAALSRLLRELTFMQVWRRLDFMVYSLGIDSDDFIEQSAPLVADHPYRFFLETRRWERKPRDAAIEKLKAALDTSNLDFNGVGLFYPVAGMDAYRARLFKISYRHGDVIEPDMILRLERFTGKAVTARGFLKGNPFCPYPAAMLIAEDWGYAGPHGVQWEKEHQDHPGVLGALGAKYLELARLDDAERCLKRAVKLSADQKLYENLADVYAARGDRAKWQATLDEFLTKPDYRLSHAQVRVKVAKYFMDEEQWDKALPYAVEAAESWAEWAMKAACRCYEEMQNYDESEKWLLRIVERYRGNEYKWYNWCIRTGHGDLKAARAAVEARIARDGTRADEETPMSVGAFYVAEHRTSQAYELFARQQRKTKDPLAGFFAALLADELKKPAERDAALDVIATEGGKYKSDGRQRTALITLAGVWSETLRAGEQKITLDNLKRVQQLSENAGFDRTNFGYFAGRMLQSLGLAEEGNKYLLLSARSTKDIRTRTLARAQLRVQGVTVDQK
ncbi:MAG TPA: tetratricopeptide repeat protein [Pirellulales bacterium]